jgi:hypothetical protein
VAHQRIDDRAERGAVHVERVTAAAGLNRKIEHRLPNVDRHRPDVPDEQRQQSDPDLQRADPAGDRAGDADGRVANLRVRLREEAETERVVADLAAREVRDSSLEGVPNAVAVHEERDRGDRGDEECHDRRDAEDEAAQPTPRELKSSPSAGRN